MNDNSSSFDSAEETKVEDAGLGIFSDDWNELNLGGVSAEIAPDGSSSDSSN